MLDKWALVHEYRRLAANDKVHPIRCPDCNDELVTKADSKTGEPVFYCFYCRATTNPGLHVWDQMREAINSV